MDIAVWLRDLGLEQYAGAFRANNVDAAVLPSLTADDLKDLGVTSIGHRRRLLDAIAALAARPGAGATPARESAAERRQLTVMFCDLVGSTGLSERLDPEDLREVISAYHRRVAEVVERFEGHVATYMGDGVLAYFGYPKAHEDAAERAVRAGLAVIEAVGRLSPGGDAALRVRVGIATGLVVVGDLIGEGAARGEVVGDTLNLAARLQALAEPHTVVIGPNTWRLVRGLFEFADLGEHHLKGFAQPVPAWRVLGPSGAECRFEARQQAAGLMMPLVGRERELALLLERWERASGGEGQVVLLAGEPGIGKSRLLQALREHVAGELAAKQPVLLVLEDAHWLDPTTRELFDLTVERVCDLPVLVVITHRPEFQPPWIGPAHVTALTLARLGPDHGRALVERVTGGKALPPEAMAQIVAKTDGVPLFVEELTKAVLESGLLKEEGGRYALEVPLPPLAIPSTLHDSLLARLERLAPVKEVAQIGAALGREFSYELLAAVAPLRDDVLRDALNRLCSSELVFCRGTPPEASYSFKHVLVQDAAYETLLRSRRQQLHARIVRVLEERFPETAEAQPELVAHHCTQAGLAEKAVHYWHEAGRQALARSATAEAVAQLTRGLEVLKRLPEGPERHRLELGLQAALGGALIATRGWAAPETGEAYARARELCERLGETEQLFPVLWGLTVFHINRGEPGAGRQVAEEMLRLAEREADVAVQIAAHRALGAALYYLGEPVATRAHLERMLALDEAVPHRRRPPPSLYMADHRVMALSFLPVTLFTLGYPGQARARGREALAHARNLAHPHSVAFALSLACEFHCVAHEWEALHAQAQDLVALSTEQSFSYYLASGTLFRGCALAALGQVHEGLALYHQGFATWRAAGEKKRLPLFLGVLAEGHRNAGRPAEALRVLAEALDWVERTDERWHEAELHRLKGEVLLSLPERGPAEAEACLHRALTVARERSAKLWELRAAVSLARLWRDQDRREEAHALLAPIYGWFTEGFDTPDLRDAKALLGGLR